MASVGSTYMTAFSAMRSTGTSAKRLSQARILGASPKSFECLSRRFGRSCSRQDDRPLHGKPATMRISLAPLAMASFANSSAQPCVSSLTSSTRVSAMLFRLATELANGQFSAATAMTMSALAQVAAKCAVRMPAERSRRAIFF